MTFRVRKHHGEHVTIHHPNHHCSSSQTQFILMIHDCNKKLNITVMLCDILSRKRSAMDSDIEHAHHHRAQFTLKAHDNKHTASIVHRQTYHTSQHRLSVDDITQNEKPAFITVKNIKTPT